MGCFGHDLFKATILWGTLPSLTKLSRKKRQCPSEFSSSSTDRYYVRNAGGVKGRRELHLTAAYPAAFGQAVLNAWRPACGPVEGPEEGCDTVS